jgi:hypothetical protein
MVHWKCNTKPFDVFFLGFFDYFGAGFSVSAHVKTLIGSVFGPVSQFRFTGLQASFE